MCLHGGKIVRFPSYIACFKCLIWAELAGRKNRATILFCLFYPQFLFWEDLNSSKALDTASFWILLLFDSPVLFPFPLPFLYNKGLQSEERNSGVNKQKISSRLVSYVPTLPSIAIKTSTKERAVLFFFMLFKLLFFFTTNSSLG